MACSCSAKEPAFGSRDPDLGQYALLRALRGEALPALELLQSYVVPGLLTRRARRGRPGFLAQSMLAENDFDFWRVNQPFCRIGEQFGKRIIPRVPSQPASVTVSAPPPIPSTQTNGFAEKGIWKTRSEST